MDYAVKKSSKFLSIFLSVSLILSGIQFLADAKQKPSEGDSEKSTNIGNLSDSSNDPSSDEILHYSFKFDNQHATEIPDDSGNGQTGVLKNANNASIIDDKIYGTKVKALYLKGGTDGGYLQMPEDVLGDSANVTVSCWVKVHANSEYQRIWDFGNDTTSYMYLLTDGHNDGESGYATAITKDGWSKEEGVESDTLGTGKWIFTTVVINSDEKTISLYKNGILLGTKKGLDTLITDIGSTKNNYIGYGQFGNDPFNGEIADFSIYKYAMTKDQVESMYSISDADKVDEDKASLDLGDLSGVTENLTLPTKGAYGSAISWSSSNEKIISNDGTVTRPATGDQNTKVQLTATLKYGEASGTKVFNVTVVANPSNQQITEHDIKKLNLGLLDCVLSNLDLPVKGDWGSKITWKSSNQDVISNDGKVTRPKAGSGKVQVTLTATVTMDDGQSTRDFLITVLPKYSYTAIGNVPDVKVMTSAGTYPKFPDSITVAYKDGTKGSVNVQWPDYPNSIDSSKYAKAGTFDVTGKIYDTGKTVKATVTVTPAHTSPAPQIEAIENDLSATDLTGNTILTQNRKRDIDYLLRLDPDRMLYNFRAAFGQDVKNAQPLGGWDAPDGLLRGHSTGHFLSALALAYSSTKSSADPAIKEENEKLKNKMDYMVSELSKLQNMSEGTASDFKTACTPNNAAQKLWSKDPTKWGKGFLSAYSPDQFALLEQYTPYATIWAPYYTYHKILAGMLDCYTYGGNKTALKVAEGMGDWVYTRLSKCTTSEQRSKMWDMYIAGEYGGMNESLATLYSITKNKNYIDAAKMFDNTTFFNNLANNVDDVRTRHANQHIPQIIGAIKEYSATGNKYYYNVASNFWDIVTARYAYSIGSVGKDEKFTEPYMQAGSIDSNNNCETCTAYNLLKLTKDLYEYAPDNAKYMDYYERTLMNHVIASQDQSVDSNHVTYMLPIGPGQSKDYSDDYDNFTCCHGTGMENHVKYQEAAYYHSSDNSTLYVNLYMPTKLNWLEKGVVIKQDTQFPSDYSKITVKGNAYFNMKLRVPYWATKAFTVKVNGKTVISSAKPSSYVSLNRTWKEGDTVEISMPFSLHLSKTPDKLDGSAVASVMYGPMVMVGKTSDTDWKTLSLSPNLDNIDINDKSAVKEFATLTTNGITLVPMYTAYNFPYDTYFKIDTVGTNDSSANKFDLVGLYNISINKIAYNYTNSSWNIFVSAMQNAKSVINDICASQDEINNAVSTLSKAENELVQIGNVNKTILQSIYDIYKNITKGNYTNSSWNIFVSAMQNAKSVIDNICATQDEINNAVSALYKAENKLVQIGNADKTILQSLYDICKNIKKGNYTNSSWSIFVSAMQKAKSVINDTFATQDQINKSVSALYKAENKLVQIGNADKTILQSLYDICKNITKGNYTNSSWSVFTAALKQARDVLLSSDTTQDQINKVLATLKSAKNKLKTESSSHHGSSSDNQESKKTKPSNHNPSTNPVVSNHFKSDTTGTYHFIGNSTYYYYKITTSDTYVPAAVSSNPSVALVELAKKLPDGYLFKVTNIGAGNATITTIAGDGTKTAFTVQGTGPNGGIASDTPYKHVITRGKAYQFKFTVSNGKGIPTFTIGNHSILKNVSLRKVGNDYYYKIQGVSKGSVGVYITLTGQSPIRKCVVTVS